MNTAIKAGVVLAVLVAILSVLIAVTGLHENPLVGGFGGIFVAIAINIGVLFWALRQTAVDSGYGKQLLNGLLIGVVGGVLIFAFSMLMLTVLFPDYLDEVKTANIEWMESMDLPEDQLEAQVRRIEASTPVGQSLAGLIGTLITSVIATAVIAIFVRRK